MRETSTPLLFQVLRIRSPKCPRRRSSSVYSRATQREAGAEARNKPTRSGRGCARISGHSSMPPLNALSLSTQRKATAEPWRCAGASEIRPPPSQLTSLREDV